MPFNTQENILVHGAEIKFYKEGIVHIHYTAGTEFNLEDNKTIFAAVTHATRLKKVRIMITGGDFASHDTESTRYNASEEVMSRCSAVAMVTQNLAERIISNFFLKIYKPKAPVRIFDSNEKALNWLQKFPNVPLG